MGSTAYPALAINTTGESPLNMLGKIEQIRGSQIQQQLQTVQLDEARTEQQSRTALMKAWADNGGDYNKTISDARTSGKVTPGDLMAFQTHAVELQTKAALLTKEQLANESSTNDIFANTLESFKQLPPEQRTPDAIKAVAGSLANSGVDISKYMPAFQSLAQNPTDENIKTLELGLKGRQWVVQNEKVQREEASAPTVTQAQQKTAADVAKSTDEAKAAHIGLLSLPSPEEAKTARIALLRKTNAETAAANATTKEKTAQTALLGAEPVVAFDPKTDQRVLTTMPQAKQLGYSNPVKVAESDVQKENEANKQFNVMQSAVSTYRGSLAKAGAISNADAATIAKLMSDKDVFGGVGEHVMGAMGMGQVNDAITSLQRSANFDALRPELQQAVVDYIRAKTAVPLVQKALTGVGRMNESVMNLDMAMIPTPIEGPSSSMKLDAFQKTIDAASQGLTRVPWLPSPQDVRKVIEGKAARDLAIERSHEENQRKAVTKENEDSLGGLPLGTTGP